MFNGHETSESINSDVIIYNQVFLELGNASTDNQNILLQPSKCLKYFATKMIYHTSIYVKHILSHLLIYSERLVYLTYSTLILLQKISHSVFNVFFRKIFLIKNIFIKLCLLSYIFNFHVERYFFVAINVVLIITHIHFGFYIKL